MCCYNIIMFCHVLEYYPISNFSSVCVGLYTMYIYIYVRIFGIFAGWYTIIAMRSPGTARGQHKLGQVCDFQHVPMGFHGKWGGIMGIIHLGIAINGGTPKSSILIGLSFMNHPFWGTAIYGNTHLQTFWGSYFRFKIYHVLPVKNAVGICGGATEPLPHTRVFYVGCK